MLCGLLTPTFGTAKVLGEDLYKSNSNIKNSIGYMAQKFSLYGNLKIKDNLDFFSGIYGLKNKKREEKIEEMIEIFDFKNYLHLNANSLPLGIKQRLSLACSVMHEPKVLFLDEPTSNFDTKAIDWYLQLIEKLLKPCSIWLAAWCYYMNIESF